MPRSFGSERQSLRAPSFDDSRDEHSSDPARGELDGTTPPEPESTRDVAQEDFLVHLYRGSELLQENRVIEAREELEHALAMRPLDPKGQDLLGAVYFRLGLYPRAIQIYEALERQFSRDVSIKVNLALGYLKTGQPDRASGVLKDAVRINPDHKRAWGYLGLAHQKLGELTEAQIAFERGGHALMAKRASPAMGSSPPPPMAFDAGLREFAETAFLELDAGELRFVLAEPEATTLSEGPWHTLELGDAVAGRGAPTRFRTLPAAPAAAPEPQLGWSHRTIVTPAMTMSAQDVGDNAPEAFAATRLMPPPLTHVPASLMASPSVPPSNDAEHANAPPPLFDLPLDGAIGLRTGGLLLVRTGDEPARAFAGRLDAIRAMAGPAITRVLRRRTRDGETSEVLGGIGSPIVRVAGAAELVLGARAAHEIALLRLEDDLAFVREEMVLGFELSLAYENGRVALEPVGEGPRPATDGSPIVQLRGTGALAVELSGKLTSLASTAGRPLIVRREWVVGWLGRLVSRALSAGDSPTGQRGLVSFAGDGLVLLCCG